MENKHLGSLGNQPLAHLVGAGSHRLRSHQVRRNRLRVLEILVRRGRQTRVDCPGLEGRLRTFEDQVRGGCLATGSSVEAFPVDRFDWLRLLLDYGVVLVSLLGCWFAWLGSQISFFHVVEVLRCFCIENTSVFIELLIEIAWTKDLLALQLIRKHLLAYYFVRLSCLSWVIIVPSKLLHGLSVLAHA